ncbi:MAG: NAD-dependent epimerase/dehydratase family protein, partial [Bacteroidia bacterium]|nr:NAD-dependent epimerase/dehydratase family protein [Bacteroidia bacterium]
IIGLRYFNVFGPKQNPNGPYAAVIPIFINKLLQQEVCTIYGDGTNHRDFTYVSNVVQANLLAATTSNVDSLNQVYNRAYGATETINDLYELIRSQVNSALVPNYATPRPGEIKDSFAEIAKAQKALGYMPNVNLNDGVLNTINWYKNNSQ